MGYMIFNGEITERKNVHIDIEDRGFQFGDGVYEVIRIYNGKPFALKPHLDRLYESARRIYMEIPYSKEELEDLLLRFIHLENLSLCNLYVQFSRGIFPRNHVIPNEGDGTFLAYALNNGSRPLETMEKGGKAVLVEDERWLNCDIKSTSLLGNVLARHKATLSGAFEAILHRGTIVTEASAANVWIVKSGVLYTHPQGKLILNGITRQVLLDICREQNITALEEPFTTDDLLQAEEVFLSSTTLEIAPVVQVDNRKIGDGSPGQLTKKLQKLYLDRIIMECGSI